MVARSDVGWDGYAVHAFNVTRHAAVQSWFERAGGKPAHATVLVRRTETAKKKARYKSGPKSNSFLRRVGGDRISMLRHSI
jgi:hypothetical protein